MRTEPTLSPGLPARPGARTDGRKISVVDAATPARPARRHTRELDREILTRIARGGLLICETELRFQLRRRGNDTPRLNDLLADLERRGLIESETHYRLTPKGAEQVPVRDRPDARAISSIPWSSASRGARNSKPEAPRSTNSPIVVGV